MPSTRSLAKGADGRGLVDLLHTAASAAAPHRRECGCPTPPRMGHRVAIVAEAWRLIELVVLTVEIALAAEMLDVVPQQGLLHALYGASPPAPCPRGRSTGRHSLSSTRSCIGTRRKPKYRFPLCIPGPGYMNLRARTTFS